MVENFDKAKQKFEEAETLLDKGEYIQACKKACMSTVEAIRVLAIEYAPDVAKEADEKGWHRERLNKAAVEISKSLRDREEIMDLFCGLSAAWCLADIYDKFTSPRTIPVGMIEHCMQEVKEMIEVLNSLKSKK